VIGIITLAILLLVGGVNAQTILFSIPSGQPAVGVAVDDCGNMQNLEARMRARMNILIK